MREICRHTVLSAQCISQHASNWFAICTRVLLEFVLVWSKLLAEAERDQIQPNLSIMMTLNVPHLIFATKYLLLNSTLGLLNDLQSFHEVPQAVNNKRSLLSNFHAKYRTF